MGNTQGSPNLRPGSCGLVKLHPVRRREDARGAFPTFEPGSFPSGIPSYQQPPLVDKEQAIFRTKGQENRRNPIRRALRGIRGKLNRRHRKRRKDLESATTYSEEECLFFQQLNKDYMPSIEEAAWRVDDEPQPVLLM